MKQFLKKLSSYLNYTAGHPVTGKVTSYWRGVHVCKGLTELYAAPGNSFHWSLDNYKQQQVSEPTK